MENQNFKKPNQNDNFRLRLFTLFGIFILFFIILLFKIIFIQVIQRDIYRKYSQGQVEKKLFLPTQRGIIYDRNNSILVDNKLSYSLSIIPAFIKSQTYYNHLIEYLSNLLGISISQLNEEINFSKNKNSYNPILIKKWLSPNEYVQLIENKKYLESVLVEHLPMRYYSLNDNLAHVLGYVGIISQKEWEKYRKKYINIDEHNPYESKNTIIGQWGIEKSFDSRLRGEEGTAILLVHSSGQEIKHSLEILKNGKAGEDIYLTIDKDLQETAKKLMYNKQGVIIISKPYTGEILTLFSQPSFNPNEIRKSSEIINIIEDPNKSFYDRAIQGRYTPGSVFKIIVALAALEGKKIDPKTKYECKGFIQLGNRIFKCNDKNGHSWVNMDEAITKSCNIYFYNLGKEIGWPIIHKWADLFHLGQGHKLEIFDSKQSILPDEEWKRKNYNQIWTHGDTFNHSIGQGYTFLYPLEIHNIISIIATGGTLYKPFLIKEIVDPIKKKIYTTKKNILKNISLKASTMEFIQKSLRSVAIKGTAYWARFSSIPIAGKTGTSQAFLNNKEISNAIFTAYAPYQSKNPKDIIAITVIIENSEHGGGASASPVATALFKRYFENKNLKDISKDIGYIFEINSKEDKESKNVLTTLQVKNDTESDLLLSKKELEQKILLINNTNSISEREFQLNEKIKHIFENTFSKERKKKKEEEDYTPKVLPQKKILTIKNSKSKENSFSKLEIKNLIPKHTKKEKKDYNIIAIPKNEEDKKDILKEDISRKEAESGLEKEDLEIKNLISKHIKESEKENKIISSKEESQKEDPPKKEERDQKEDPPKKESETPPTKKEDLEIKNLIPKHIKESEKENKIIPSKEESQKEDPPKKGSETPTTKKEDLEIKNLTPKKLEESKKEVKEDVQ